MNNQKYSNGMYKGQSKAQNLVSNSIFKAFYENGLLDYMTLNFDQISGHCTYEYTFKALKHVYYVQLDRTGKTVDSGFIA